MDKIFKFDNLLLGKSRTKEDWVHNSSSMGGTYKLNARCIRVKKTSETQCRERNQAKKISNLEKIDLRAPLRICGNSFLQESIYLKNCKK